MTSDKCEGTATCTCFIFLGMEIDTIKLKLRLPTEKLARLKCTWFKHCYHAPQAVSYFIGWLNQPTITPVVASFALINLNAQSDILWWHTFIEDWNGLSMIQYHSASNALGSCGAYYKVHWLQHPWLSITRDYNITAKELLAIVLAAAAWGKDWKFKSVLCRCDWLEDHTPMQMHCPIIMLPTSYLPFHRPFVQLYEQIC